MKSAIKSVITIVTAMVMMLSTSVTVSAERRKWTTYDYAYREYLMGYEAMYGVESAGMHYRDYPDGSPCRYYDWNMDKKVDVEDAQFILNDYVWYMTLGDINSIPQALYDKIEDHYLNYRKKAKYSHPKDSIVCAQLILSYYTKALSGTDYVWVNEMGPGPAGPVIVRMYKRKASGFLDWLQNDGIKVKG